MGRWGLSELPVPGPAVVGLMTHLATADTDRDFAHEQLERFLRATEPYAGVFARHVANSAAALLLSETRLDAARCGIALYGIDPFGEEPRRFDLRPALRWESDVAQVRRLAPGESTGYGRVFVAQEETWIAHRPGRVRGRVPARPDGHGRARRRRALAAWSARSRWTRSRSRSRARSRSARR